MLFLDKELSASAPAADFRIFFIFRALPLISIMPRRERRKLFRWRFYASQIRNIAYNARLCFFFYRNAF